MPNKLSSAPPQQQRRRREDKKDWANLSLVAIALISLFGSYLYNSYSVATKIATVPYVDGKFAESKTYTDSTAVSTTIDCHKYSDSNHEDMLLRMERLSGEWRTANATLGTKVDNLTIAVNRLTEIIWSNPKARSK